MEFMYASGSDNDIYHLVARNESETLCGLRISRLQSQHALHIVHDITAGVICKHCARIKRNAESIPQG